MNPEITNNVLKGMLSSEDTLAAYHQQFMRESEGTSSGADSDENDPGPSQSKTKKKSAKSETKTHRMTDSTGSSITLQRGKDDAMFGHYWCRLEMRIKKDMQSGTSSSFSHVAECSSSDEQGEEVEYKKTEAECAIATHLASSSAERYSKYMNVLEQKIECKTGVPFRQQQAEPQGIPRELLTASKFASTSKDLLHDEPLDLTVRKKSSDQQTSTPNTVTKGSESTNVYRIQFSKDLNRKKETIIGKGKKKIDTSRSLHCGICKEEFGQRAAVLGKLMFKDRFENSKSFSFKCLCCSNIVECANFYTHIISHFKNDKLFCRKCQINSKCGKVIYDLETPDFSEQVVPSDELNKIAKETQIPKLAPQAANALSEMSVHCEECKNSFDDVSNKLQRMYQCFDSSEVKESSAVFCCIICGKTRIAKPNIDKHLLTHFQSNAVFCQTCYNKEPLESNPEIKLTDVVNSTNNEMLRVFDPPINIVCKKCGRNLADSAVLDAQPFRQYVTTIQDDDLKLSVNLIYKCLICCDLFEVSDIRNHIADHIDSDHLACRNCFAEDQKSIVILERFHFRSAPGRVDVSCKQCGESFSKDLESRCSGYVLYTPFRKYKKRVYVCEFCKRSFRRKDDALIHIKKHIGEENIFCSFCRNKEK